MADLIFSGSLSLNSMWKDRALSKELKARLMRLLVWPVATFGCETWTLKASDRKRISAFEMTSYRRMLRISWKEHRTKQSILEEIGEETRLLKDIQRRKLHFFGAHGQSGQPVHGGPSWLDQW